ncbi:hypothetical protein SAMN04488518_101745 [Pseudovibrio ascidiaceicola]|uniref:MotA/TolQ/ExbB proton channel domain-containing protein n=1 Tax=Pseudovibrio ascidiaceicola TaxID=285279 RepID=A0A1I3W0U7_9HYPH|nr:hypothetical protein [Pseudovibrio ascidiaceicola]SFK01050.1 hypothetical protein SAMN04488518_101745 [Pseudovibrio ascidiaceicola]
MFYKETFLKLYESTVADPVAVFFIVLIIGLFLFSLLGSFKQIRFFSKLSPIAPNLLTTIGIFGTFFGITLGLTNFDVSNIDGSVPELLAGLKIAFITSIVGISTSIMLKAFQNQITKAELVGQIGPQEIYSLLQRIEVTGRENSEMLQENLSDIRKVISSDGESSLLTQLQKLRSEAKDGQNELITEFKNFAKHMTENNQKAIIEALQEVIRDFNNNLTEQFGDNFKQLNAAVEKLVIWQENYKEHIDKTEERIQATLSSLEAALSAVQSCAETLATIREHTEAIPAAVQPLPELAGSLNSQISVMEKHLETLALLRDKAVTAFPVIENNLELITTKLGEHVDQAVQRSSETLARHTENYKTLEEGFEGLQRQASNAQQEFNEKLSTTLNNVNAQVTEAVKKHGELIESNAKAAQNTIQESWSKTDAELEKQMQMFDKQMSQELERAIEQLGTRLASLSEKFVQDYEPLTRELHKLVNLARQVA